MTIYIKSYIYIKFNSYKENYVDQHGVIHFDSDSDRYISLKIITCYFLIYI